MVSQVAAGEENALKIRVYGEKGWKLNGHSPTARTKYINSKMAGSAYAGY